MVAFFLMFEIWFKVPLPKGPLEAALGFELGPRAWTRSTSLLGGFEVALSLVQPRR